MPEDGKIIELVSRVRSAGAESDREEAIREILSLDEKGISKLFFPKDKSLWDTCAYLLGRIGFPGLSGFLPSCLEWYQDLNWPGIEAMTRLLGQADPDMVLMQMENAARIALADQDEQWLGGLKYLARKLNIDLTRFRDQTLAQSLIQNEFY